jgi:hypothetical protein
MEYIILLTAKNPFWGNFVLVLAALACLSFFVIVAVKIFRRRN